jgi:NADPH:quinone reductase-like Zn-dependent oxidoreductase
VKPANVSAIDAGAAGIAVLTAWRGIVHHGKVKTLSSPKVIVIGASGGVGSYGVQIAKAFGAHVIAICSGKNAELAKKLGADQVLDYTVENSIREFSIEEKDAVDIIFDTVGGDDYWDLLSSTLKPSGVYSSAVGPTEHGGSQRVGFMEITRTIASIAAHKMFGSRKYQFIYSLPYEDMDEITKLFEEGKVKSYVPEDQVFPLKDGAKAHELIASHRAKGKIVLVMN